MGVAPAKMRQRHRYFPISPTVAARLQDRPRAFLDVASFARHVMFLLAPRWAWLWQLPATYLAWYLIGPILGGAYGVATRQIPVALAVYSYGFLLGPLVEELARLFSIRTRSGAFLLGAGFAWGFPLWEAIDYLGHAAFYHTSIEVGFVTLRLISIAAHLYFHYVQAYRLSLAGSSHRAGCSFLTAVALHSTYNALTSVFGRVFA